MGYLKPIKSRKNQGRAKPPIPHNLTSSPIVKNIVSHYSPLLTTHIPLHLNFQKFTYPHHQPHRQQPHPIHLITQIIYTPTSPTTPRIYPSINLNPPILSTFLSTTQSPYFPLPKTINHTIQLTKLSTANTIPHSNSHTFLQQALTHTHIPTNPTPFAANKKDPVLTESTSFILYTHHTSLTHLQYIPQLFKPHSTALKSKCSHYPTNSSYHTQTLFLALRSIPEPVSKHMTITFFQNKLSNSYHHSHQHSLLHTLSLSSVQSHSQIQKILKKKNLVRESILTISHFGSGHN